MRHGDTLFPKNPDLAFYKDALKDDRQEIKQFENSNNDERFFLAISNEVVVGTIRIHFEPDMAFVRNLSVLPIAQRNGVCRREARERGYEFVIGETFELNKEAVQTQFALGSPIDRVEHKYAGENHKWYVYKVPTK